MDYGRNRKEDTTSSITIKKTTVTSTTNTNKSRPKLLFTFACDCSGSMANTKIKVVEESFKDIVASALVDKDKLEFITFADEAKKRCGLLAKPKIDWDRIHQELQTGGQTALYDAIKIAIQTMPKDVKYKDCQRELVVLTDGEDNCSKCSMKELKEIVAHPQVSNFHLIIIGVGITNTYEQQLRSLCSPQHCTYLPSGNDAAEIKKMFRQAKLQIIQRTELLIQVSVTSIGNNGSNNNSLISMAQILAIEADHSKSNPKKALKSVENDNNPVWIGDIAFGVTKTEILKKCSRIGECSVVFFKEAPSYGSKGSAIVVFGTKKDADNAIESLNQITLNGLKLVAKHK